MFYAFVHAHVQLTGGFVSPTVSTGLTNNCWVRRYMHSSYSWPLGISFNQDQVGTSKFVRGPHSHLPLEDPFPATHPSRSCLCSTYSTLLKKLETALEHRQLPDAWETFCNFKRLYGYPVKHLLHKLLGELSYSADSLWIRKAYQLASDTMKERPDMLCDHTLVGLSLTLSRCQMPIPATTILRFLLRRSSFPPINVWSLVFMHLVKSKVGTYLASEMLIEISNCFLEHRRELKKNAQFLNSVTPDTTVFNLVLNACVNVGSVLKAQEIIELMAMTGTTADSASIAIMSLIHEINGLRDEVKKLATHMNSPSSIQHCQLLYNSLLSLNFKFGDLDAAAEFAVDLYKQQKLCPLRSKHVMHRSNKCQYSSLVSIGPARRKAALSMMVEPKPSLNIAINIDVHPDLVNFNEGRPELSYKSLAKFINGYARVGKIEKLAKLFLMIRKQLDETKEFDNMVNEVIVSCVQSCSLNAAHDIIEDVETGLHIQENSYLCLLRGYLKENRLTEAKVLIKQMRKVSLLHILPDEILLDPCKIDTRRSWKINSSLAECLVYEMCDDDRPLMSVAEINSAIYFFCKSNMIEDALKLFSRLKSLNLRPTAQTFNFLINAYSSLGMFREITILWGEIKGSVAYGDVKENRDLHDSLLCNFLRGGYFERAMEIVALMNEHGMFIDKLKYKREFLRFHRYLYRGLKASDAKGEVQLKRIEHVRAFRRWVGIIR